MNRIRILNLKCLTAHIAFEIRIEYNSTLYIALMRKRGVVVANFNGKTLCTYIERE